MTDTHGKKNKDSRRSQMNGFRFPFGNMNEISKMIAGCCSTEDEMSNCCAQMRERCCPESGDDSVQENEEKPEKKE